MNYVSPALCGHKLEPDANGHFWYCPDCGHDAAVGWLDIPWLLETRADLLEAAEALIADIDHINDQMLTPSLVYGLRSAIAKARGES